MIANVLRFAAWTYSLLAISSVFQELAPEAYMDEIFHVPQTLQYCQGNFKSWDPKITTFPGLYFVGATYGSVVNKLEKLFGIEQKAPLCSVSTLRAVNTLLAAHSTRDIFDILKMLHPTAPQPHRILMTGVLAAYPLHFFFTFLYYTDVGALAMLLSAYLSLLQGRYVSCAAWSTAAVAFRQTNAVWAAWMLGVAVVDRCLSSCVGVRQASVQQQVLDVLRAVWRLKGDLLSTLWPLLLPPLAFAAFLVLNGGVVLGDKEAHTPVWHLTQPLYCAAFITLALAPIIVTKQRIRAAVHWMTSSPISAALLLSVLCAIVHTATYAHPYLIADNRHYTFYLWRRSIGWHWLVRYLLVPGYAVALWCLNDSLRDSTSDLWRIGLLGATALTLVPAGLLELRYFTVPYMLTAVHLPIPSSRVRLALTLLAYLIVNGATIHMFINTPFTWPDGSTARFMW